MTASKSSLLLLNFVTEYRWFDLFIAEFGKRHRAIQCNETLLLNCFLIIARVSLLSTKVLFQFQIQ